MILDNADDTSLFFGTIELGNPSTSRGLSQFLPQCENGSILFTTRNKKTGVKFATKNIIVLEKMTAAEAEELLQTRLVEKIVNQNDAASLLEALEYTPLAIAQAAAYMAENSISITEYLELYNESETSRIELLSEDFEELARDSETINPIAATWIISFEQIRKADMLAADLLSSMACLDRQGIPKELLPLTGNPAKVTTALGLLKAYSLITANKDNTYDMHRLVHLATRSWLRTNGTFDDRVKSCLIKLAEKFPMPGFDGIDTCISYAPHAEAVAGDRSILLTHDEDDVLLAGKFSLYLLLQGRWKDAEAVTRKVLEWLEVLPKEDPRLNI